MSTSNSNSLEIGLYHVMEGLVTRDGQLTPDTDVLISCDELVLRHMPSGAEFSIPTLSRPEAGSKVVAQCSLEAVFASPMVRKVSPAGGALNASRSLARRLQRAGTEEKVHLLNSGTDSAELGQACQQDGVVCHSIGHQESPRTLTIQLPRDRVIVKEASTLPPDSLQRGQLEMVDRIVSRATDVTSVSSKNAALAAATTSLCNGARRIFQPTGSLAPEMTLLLASQANEVVCNLAEWGHMAKSAGLALPDPNEESPEAPEAAAHLVRSLRHRRWAGLEAAVCTIGRRGSVVADWQEDRVWFIALEMIQDGDSGIPTPAGSGDMYLAEWIFYRPWSIQGHLRHPAAAAAMRATYEVARTLGLCRSRFVVKMIAL